MAYNRDITADDKVFFDTDRALSYTIAAGDPTTAELEANDYVPVDVTGFSFAWVLKATAASDTALIEKTTAAGGITITGTYNVNPVTNTQRVRVQIEDEDTYGPDPTPAIIVAAPATYHYALKRLDAGAETIYVWGKFRLLLAAAWEG
jgi:hypothetical protein